MHLLEYPVTRLVKPGPRVTVGMVLAAVTWIVVVTLINVPAAGYELARVSSTDFNNITRNWYEKLVPGSDGIIPSCWTCLPSVIKVN
jgi:hypothetical protein